MHDGIAGDVPVAYESPNSVNVAASASQFSVMSNHLAECTNSLQFVVQFLQPTAFHTLAANTIMW